MTADVAETYGNRVRVRACGLCVVDEQLLMVNHHGLSSGNFWAPPGGGIEVGESALATLEREFLEETNIRVQAGNLLFVAEFIKSPLHAIELFFKVDFLGGVVKKGVDPEMKDRQQIIAESRFLSWREIGQMDKKELHGIFKYASEPHQIIDLRGYFKL